MFRWIPTVAGLLALAGFGALYRFAWPVYNTLLYLIGVRAFDYPFLDFEARLAGTQCWGHGVAVYALNPCDILLRPYNYSPIWLRFQFLPGTAWTTSLGCAIAVVFFLSLALLPWPRTGPAWLLMLAATLSPRVAFAIERLNVDVIMFLLALAAGLLMTRGRARRMSGYAVIVFAALLKFYPVTLLVVALRERPRVFVAIVGAAVAVLGAYALYFRDELALIAEKIPGGSPFTGLFGAINLPRGVAMVMERGHLPYAGIAVALVWASLAVGAVWQIARLARWADLRTALARAPVAVTNFLLIGALLIETCFFTGQSFGYRGVHFLLALAPLLALASSSTGPVRRFAWLAGILITILMWDGALTWRGGGVPDAMIDWLAAAMAWRIEIPQTMPGTIVATILWVARELVWWWVAAILAGLIVCCLQDSPIGIWLTRRFGIGSNGAERLSSP